MQRPAHRMQNTHSVHERETAAKAAAKIIESIKFLHNNKSEAQCAAMLLRQSPTGIPYSIEKPRLGH